MPRREWRAYVEDVVTACEKIQRYTRGADWARYADDDQLRSSVERQLGIIGEAVTRLRLLRPDIAGSLGDVRGIIDFRNVLIHGYFAVKHDIVWSILTSEVGPLRDAAQRLMGAEGQDDPGPTPP